jgi:Flp pilus assembly protein TadG
MMITRFYKNCDGVASIEVALVMPVLLALLLGMMDIGNALLINKKTSTGAQIAADLLTRHISVTDADISDAYVAAQMAIAPYDRTKFGMDTVSIQFQGSTNTPVIMWRQTSNMTANSDVTTIASGLGVSGEGVLIVTTQYIYTPSYTHSFVDAKTMREVAVTRPRRGSYIVKK